MRLAERVAIVTGAAQGLGFGIAERFLAEGAKVVMADIQEEKVKAQAPRACTAVGRGADTVLALPLDVSRTESVDAMVERTIERFGRIDILVNDAGGSGTRSVIDIEQIDDALWDAVVNTNLKGTFLCCRAVMPHMRKQAYGRIVNLSSSLARGMFGGTGTVGARLPYVAAKAAILGFTAQLAKDVGTAGITVNAIVPGLILGEPGSRVRDRFQALTEEAKAALTKSLPLGRTGEASEIAAVALFLASEEASYVSGTSLAVDGASSF